MKKLTIIGAVLLLFAIGCNKDKKALEECNARLKHADSLRQADSANTANFYKFPIKSLAGFLPTPVMDTIFIPILKNAVDGAWVASQRDLLLYPDPMPFCGTELYYVSPGRRTDITAIKAWYRENQGKICYDILMQDLSEKHTVSVQTPTTTKPPGHCGNIEWGVLKQKINKLSVTGINNPYYNVKFHKVIEFYCTGVPADPIGVRFVDIGASDKTFSLPCLRAMETFRRIEDKDTIEVYFSPEEHPKLLINNNANKNVLVVNFSGTLP